MNINIIKSNIIIKRCNSSCNLLKIWGKIPIVILKVIMLINQLNWKNWPALLQTVWTFWLVQETLWSSVERRRSRSVAQSASSSRARPSTSWPPSGTSWRGTSRPSWWGEWVSESERERIEIHASLTVSGQNHWPDILFCYHQQELDSKSKHCGFKLCTDSSTQAWARYCAHVCCMISDTANRYHENHF